MGISNPTPGSPLTMEVLLQLADFVSRPDYVDRLREVKEATEQHNEAEEVARMTLETSIAAQKQLAADKKAHEQAVAEYEAKVAAKTSELNAKEMALRGAEHNQRRREEDHASKAAADRAEIVKATADAGNKALELDSREAAVKQREDAADKRHADLQRRFAKLKEAAS